MTSKEIEAFLTIIACLYVIIRALIAFVKNDKDTLVILASVMIIDVCTTICLRGTLERLN